MAKNYYEILELSRSAQLDEISAAYRRLASRWHPRKHREDLNTAMYVFNELTEAFEVLSDPTFRAIYDSYGEYTLKDGVRVEGSQDPIKYQYRGNADEVFEKFFGSSNPFFEDYRVLDKNLPNSIFGSAEGGLSAPKRICPEDLIIQISCTLSELYNGCSKTVEYHRRRLNPDKRNTSLQKESKTIQIRAGYSKDTRLTFQGEGHESAGAGTSDLIMEITEVPHSEFKRFGNDLVYKPQVSLLQALLGNPIHIVRFNQTTLDNRVVSVSFDESISPETVRVIENEGMPVLKDNEFSESASTFGKDRRSVERGRLIVQFRILFPQYLSEGKKQAFARIFAELPVREVEFV